MGSIAKGKWDSLAAAGLLRASMADSPGPDTVMTSDRIGRVAAGSGLAYVMDQVKSDQNSAPRLPRLIAWNRVRPKVKSRHWCTWPLRTYRREGGLTSEFDTFRTRAGRLTKSVHEGKADLGVACIEVRE